MLCKKINSIGNVAVPTKESFEESKDSKRLLEVFNFFYFLTSNCKKKNCDNCMMNCTDSFK
jgi:hypothetical protein